MIINKIRKLRTDKELTQEEFARLLNISRQTLISIEDNNDNISLNLAFKISKVLNKDINEIFIEMEEKELGERLENIDEVKKAYGKNTIFIKDNLVFRCSTENLEIGPRCLISHELPKYGKMNKFIILNDKVYNLIQTREYESRTDIVFHKIGQEANIDCSFIDFDERKAWNYNK